MIIYKIQNKINKKCYIGQTVHDSFHRRYSGGKWWDNTDNPLLINAHKKYGQENFEIEILKDNVLNIEQLNKLEEFYAEKFNAYAPTGYNLRKCGDNRRLLPHQIEIIKKCKSKTFLLRRIVDWQLLEITNLKQFCRENNLCCSAIYNMIQGRDNVVVSQGYCLADKTKQEVDERKMRSFKNKIFEVVNEQEELIEITYLKKFLKENNLEKGSFYKLLNGEMLYYKGFRLPERVGEPKTNETFFEFLSPEKEIIKGYGLTKFCKENNLLDGQMRKLRRKEIIEHRGWTHPDTSEEDLFMKG
ncbi:MAG: GIY-YIG nuclease family protein, partial [Nanoarchaeota archaeon]